MTKREVIAILNDIKLDVVEWKSPRKVIGEKIDAVIGKLE